MTRIERTKRTTHSAECRFSREFAFRKIHLGMLLHKLFEHVLLLLLVRGGQAHLLLPLVVHHLLHQSAGLAVQVGQFARLRVDLFGADLRVRRDEFAPPFHLVDLLQGEQHRILVLQEPGGLFHFDLVLQLAVQEASGRIFESGAERRLVDDHVEVPRAESGRLEGDPHLKYIQGGAPLIRK